eukprot:CAMPEP_0184855964 /NCGR_PEP_ID=MMETSP0580-20130426/1127_1 /TAXON_ID=1118495 /ORGANISM="Dactyliosolen fragilissimus" /LENGTH=279 /DNA_ID=CAMNT_0027350683 /DNA_START=47 /DNA_END=886 /DNA_ORIENTATION=+
MPVPRAGGGDGAGMNNLGGPQDWYDSLPIVTKHWLTAAIATTVAANFGVFGIDRLIWDFDSLKNNFEIWRFLTPFFYVGPFEFRTAIRFLTLYQFSLRYETEGPYNTGGGGGTSDYVYMLLFGMVSSVLLAFVSQTYLFSSTMIFYVLYLWAKRNPIGKASIFGISMKAAYFPFALLLFEVFVGNPWYDIVKGYAIAHLFYFLVDVVPFAYGKDYLQTPNFLIDFFGSGIYVPPVSNRTGDAVGNNTWSAPGRTRAPNDPAANRGSSHNWGGGRTLGTN